MAENFQRKGFMFGIDTSDFHPFLGNIYHIINFLASNPVLPEYNFVEIEI